MIYCRYKYTEVEKDQRSLFNKIFDENGNIRDAQSADKGNDTKSTFQNGECAENFYAPSAKQVTNSADTLSNKADVDEALNDELINLAFLIDRQNKASKSKTIASTQRRIGFGFAAFFKAPDDEPFDDNFQLEKTFTARVLDFLGQHSLSNAELCSKAKIIKQTLSAQFKADKEKSKSNYDETEDKKTKKCENKIKKNTVFAIAVALRGCGMSKNDVVALIQSAGYAFSPSSLFDQIVKRGILARMSIDEINDKWMIMGLSRLEVKSDKKYKMSIAN